MEEVVGSMEEKVRIKDRSFIAACFIFYKQICDLGNNKTKYGSESGEDSIIKAGNRVKLQLVWPTVRPRRVAQNSCAMGISNVRAWVVALWAAWSLCYFWDFFSELCGQACV